MTQSLTRGVSRRWLVACVAVFAAAMAAQAWLMEQAHAQAQDYSDLTTGFGAELAAALPVALTAVGLFIGVIMAYKVVRRILRA